MDCLASLRAVRGLPTLFLLVAACGDDAPLDPDLADGGSIDARRQLESRCEQGQLADPAPDFTSLDGEIDLTTHQAAAEFPDSMLPALAMVAAESGACRLLRTDIPFCEDPCDLSAACTADDVCTPWPANRSAGDVTLTTSTGTYHLVLGDYNHYLYTGEEPIAAPCEEVTLTATGDQVPGFTVTAPVSSFDLVVEDPDQWAGTAVTGDEDLVVRWEPAGAGERIRLTMPTDLGHAAYPPVVIECDTPDTGSITVPRALVSEWADPDNWACGVCPRPNIIRYRRTTVATPAGELRVLAMTGRPIEIFPFDTTP
jgi:hypothetical protein